MAQQYLPLLEKLDEELKNEDSYVKSKHSKISNLQDEVQKNLLRSDTRDLYSSYLKLFEEYKSFKYDSAYYYIEEAKELALLMDNDILVAQTGIKEGFVLLSSGLFKEALDVLSTIDPNKLDDKTKFDYYFIMARAYFDMANYNDDPRFRINYVRQGNRYLEEALVYAEPNSSNFWSAVGLMWLKQQEWDKAREAFHYWIDFYDLPPDLYGVATSSLSFIYSQTGNFEKAIEYLALAAISDVQSATKENIALRNLATELYNVGELEKANTYVHSAMRDATFYNARHRKIEISSILPIIEGAQLIKAEQKNATLVRVVVLLAFLAFIVIIFLYIILKQLKAKNVARTALSEYTHKLEETNLNLLEADAIKQDYITYFLKATSGLIHKMDHLQKSTRQKIKTRQPEEVLAILKKYSVQKERNDLFHQFDEVFLKLFPTFIEEFNNLFPPDQRRERKKGELLNTELRIFALYRLGIQDNQQVAEFLEISVATIYSYKTRLKSRSLYKNSFEERIMSIKRL
ncbi:hypothetical protein FHG64_06190 [Antarcticibacterium flavum]|uniref:DUF6377 domain-containing protein n=2 Tax=Flavobacteriaceae TaxID=49546 RepID=A0A5B7X7I5_9FLAO|nr:hypothetical protein [Antarcticibacterium sp. W02-3]QCY71369.1 hypothetical protein FHG64_06190 [Antarcticibacterium flavum]